MCGLLYARRGDNRSVVKSLIKRYETQKLRGTQGFGYIVIRNGVVADIKRAKYEYFIKEFLKAENGADEILFHHRFPTSTENIEEMTHPIVVKNEKLKHNYYVIHNGVLINEHVLKRGFEDMGFKYTTDIKKTTTIEVQGKIIKEETIEGFNDSESFAIDLALFLDGAKDKLASSGSISFICLQTDKQDNVLAIHYGRNAGNPLVIEDNNDLFIIKSSGYGKSIDENKLFTIDYKTGKTTVREVDIGIKPPPIKPQTIGFCGQQYLTEGRGVTHEHYLDELKKKDLYWGEPAFGEGDYTENDDGYTQPNNNYGDSQIESYYCSQQRLDDINEEYHSLLTDVKLCKKQLRGHKKLTSDEHILYTESMKESLEKMKSIKEEMDWIKGMLTP